MEMRFPERFSTRITNGTELEEVVRRPARHHGLASSRARVKLKAVNRLGNASSSVDRANLQSILQMLINLHDGGLVTAPVAVVGCYT